MTQRKNRRKSTRNRIFEAYNWVCHLCNGAIDPKLRAPDPKAGTIDHVIPLAKGGKDSLTNIKPAHLKCNHQKGPGQRARGDRYYPI